MLHKVAVLFSLLVAIKSTEETPYQAALSKFERPSEIMACVNLVRYIDFAEVDSRLAEIMADPNYQATREASQKESETVETLAQRDTREFLYILIGTCYDRMNTLPVRTKQLVIAQSNSTQNVEKHLIEEVFDMENAFRVFSTMSGSELQLDDINGLIEGMKVQATLQKQEQIEDLKKNINDLQDLLDSRLDTIESGRYLTMVGLAALFFGFTISYYSTRFCCNKIKKIEQKEVREFKKVAMKRGGAGGVKNTNVELSAELKLLSSEEKQTADTLAKLEAELKKLATPT